MILEPEAGNLLRLSLIPGVGPRAVHALLERFGDPARIFTASLEELKRVDGIGSKTAERIVASTPAEVDSALAHCARLGVEPIFKGADPYPKLLAEIPDPPPVLYMKGSITSADALAIAIVGSRRSTPYGVRVAERLGASLARVGFTVVSGLARGIDTAAHRGALKAGGRTIAVLANGLESIYPPENEGLAAEIITSGALISESRLDQEPRAGLFPQRNRLISGISLGVVVVEASPRGGSLSTARHAGEQNREVFAVPGPIDSLSSRGCHALIRDGAKLVETIDDILEELGPLGQKIQLMPDSPEVRHPAELKLSEQERSILAMIDPGPVTIDELIVRTRLTASQVMATLGVLEMRRLIRRLGGQQSVRA